MPYEVRQATAADAKMLAPRLRAEDIAEIKAASGRRPQEVLVEGVLGGEAWVAQAEEGLLGVFGVRANPFDPIVGHPWMLATPLLLSHQKQFVKDCRGWVKRLGRDFKLLNNVVDHRNQVHIRWLEWCGFKFLHLHPFYGVERRPFWEFIKHV